MATEPYAEPTLPGAVPRGDPSFPRAPEGVPIEGRSPWYLGYRRLRRNKTALAFLALFILVLIFVLAARLSAKPVAHTGPGPAPRLERTAVHDNREGVA